MVRRFVALVALIFMSSGFTADVSADETVVNFNAEVGSSTWMGVFPVELYEYLSLGPSLHLKDIGLTVGVQWKQSFDIFGVQDSGSLRIPNEYIIGLLQVERDLFGATIVGSYQYQFDVRGSNDNSSMSPFHWPHIHAPDLYWSKLSRPRGPHHKFHVHVSSLYLYSQPVTRYMVTPFLFTDWLNSRWYSQNLPMPAVEIHRATVGAGVQITPSIKGVPTTVTFQFGRLGVWRKDIYLWQRFVGRQLVSKEYSMENNNKYFGPIMSMLVSPKMTVSVLGRSLHIRPEGKIMGFWRQKVIARYFERDVSHLCKRFLLTSAMTVNVSM